MYLPPCLPPLPSTKRDWKRKDKQKLVVTRSFDANLVFGLCGKISGRLRNLSGSPRDVVHVEEGIDDEEQVPLMREDKREF